MLDIKFLRENPELVKENIRKKFQDRKLPMVDEAIALDLKRREGQAEADNLRNEKNKISKEIGKLMGQGKREEAMAIKEEIAKQGARVNELTEEERTAIEKLEHRRWNAYMRSEGYIYSGSHDKASRNDLGKMHHDLIEYDQMDDEEKRKDSKLGTK